MKTGKVLALAALSLVGGLSLQAQEKTYKLSDFFAGGCPDQDKGAFGGFERKPGGGRRQPDRQHRGQTGERPRGDSLKSTKAIGSDPVPATVYYAAPLTYLSAPRARVRSWRRMCSKAGISGSMPAKEPSRSSQCDGRYMQASIAAGGQIQSGGR